MLNGYYDNRQAWHFMTRRLSFNVDSATDEENVLRMIESYLYH